MLDPKKTWKLDQDVQQIAEVTSALTWNMFSKLKIQGFSDAQAFLLSRDFLCTYISECFSGKRREENEEGGN